jgi:16S rRNA processing protein RimM
VSRLVVGLVRGLHGLGGYVRIEVLTDEPARFDVGRELFPEGTERRLTIGDVRHENPPGVLVKFDDIDDRNAAEWLRNTYLEAEVEPAALPPGSYYWHDIIGSRVLTEDGRALGEVADIFRVGEGEVYVVRGESGEVLVPAVAAVVRELAPADKRMVVDAAALGLDDKGENPA